LVVKNPGNAGVMDQILWPNSLADVNHVLGRKLLKWPMGDHNTLPTDAHQCACQLQSILIIHCFSRFVKYQ
jgi:hypothetical protein